jgi:hypothetical protein
VLIPIYRASYDLLGGLDYHVCDLAADLAQGRLPLAVYLLAGTLDDAVALLTSLPLGPLALGLGLLAGFLEYLPAFAAGLLDLAPVLGQELAGLGTCLCGLVYSTLYLGLALLDLPANRRLNVTPEEEDQDAESYQLPEDQAGVERVEYGAHASPLASSTGR